MVSNDEWDIKVGTGMSMKNVQRHGKRLKRRLTAKKIKPVALAIAELCLSKGISQSVSRKLIFLNSAATFESISG